MTSESEMSSSESSVNYSESSASESSVSDELLVRRRRKVHSTSDSESVNSLESEDDNMILHSKKETR